MIQPFHRAITWLCAASLVGTLSACGGGSSSDQCRSIDPTRTGCGAAASVSLGIASAALTLALTDAAGAPITTVTPQRAGAVKAMLKDASGNPMAGAVVAFTTTDKTAILVPASGTALTDSTGAARIDVGAGTQAGGFILSATATSGTTSVTSTLGYSVSFPALTFSALTIAPTPLAAGGTASLMVTVLDNGQPFAPAQSVSFTSPCAAAGKATISSPVTTVAGVATTSYVDKGCGAADAITATTTLAGGTISQTGSIAVLGAIAGQLSFISALPQNIAMKGTGGPGRQESSIITFKVMDKNGNPVAGASVEFLLFGTTSSVSGTGGLTLNPARATSGADGTVSTTLLAGIVNTPVRVTATITNSSPSVSSTSDQLVISTGIPDQNSFSLSTTIYNVEGASFNGCPAPTGSTVAVSLADHFNNPVPDGTAVSFTAEGGVIDASCLTGLTFTTLTNGTVIQQKGIPGTCTVRFCSANPRPDDGRVTIMAYALGEEAFTEDPTIANSINRFDDGEPFQDLCEPVRYDAAIINEQANPVWSMPFLKASQLALPSNQARLTCQSPGMGETFIDTNGDGKYNGTGDRQYNGVLKLDPVTGQTVANNKLPTVHVRASLVQVMSGSKAVFTPTAGSSVITLDHCVDGTPFANAAVNFSVAIRDNNPIIFLPNTLPGNILPAGTRIDFIPSNGVMLNSASYVVPNTNDPSSREWTYTATLRSDATQNSATSLQPLACNNASRNGMLTVKVTTPMGIVTEATYSVTD